MLLKFLGGYQPDATHTKGGIRADVRKTFGASMIRYHEYFHGYLIIGVGTGGAERAAAPPTLRAGGGGNAPQL